jgi:hypothetical protein
MAEPVDLNFEVSDDHLQLWEHKDWRYAKDGETAGIEDPKKKNHLMSAARYGLTMLAGAGSTYDPLPEGAGSR